MLRIVWIALCEAKDWSKVFGKFQNMELENDWINEQTEPQVKDY